jgi:hypothetical protein
MNYFFPSDEASSLASGVTLAARPLAAHEVNLVQSWAVCPSLPQNKQSFLSKRLWHSSEVSFPSLPNLEVRSRGFGADEVENTEGFPDLFCLEL